MRQSAMIGRDRRYRPFFRRKVDPQHGGLIRTQDGAAHDAPNWRAKFKRVARNRRNAKLRRDRRQRWRTKIQIHQADIYHHYWSGVSAFIYFRY